jgi:uncharacterized protein (DUF2336 family)
VLCQAFLLSNSDFRHIARKGATDRAERLFRAAVTAYCSLSRPIRAETVQLEDLTLPLYDSVSDETLRFVAAALSECSVPPPALVLRLCNERPEISAPLLVRTTALSDADLVGLIGKHGISHARVIARRSKLHPAIAALISLLDKQAPAQAQISVVKDWRKAEPDERPAERPLTSETRAEMARRTLRSMMFSPHSQGEAYRELRIAALTGQAHVLTAALGDALHVDEVAAAALLQPAQSSMLITALRSLALSGEQAFLIAACAAPARFIRHAAISDFVEQFSARSISDARYQIESWRADANERSKTADPLNDQAQSA